MRRRAPAPLASLGAVVGAARGLGCGSSGATNFLDVGSDDGGSTIVLDPGAGGGAHGGLDAHIERSGITVTFVTGGP